MLQVRTESYLNQTDPLASLTSARARQGRSGSEIILQAQFARTGLVIVRCSVCSLNL